MLNTQSCWFYGIFGVVSKTKKISSLNLNLAFLYKNVAVTFSLDNFVNEMSDFFGGGLYWCVVFFS